MKLSLVHFTFLFTKRVKLYMIIVIVISGLFYVAIAHFNAPIHEQSYFNTTYRTSYRHHQLSFLKWMGLITVLFMSAHGFIYNAYDALFINMQPTNHYLLSKVMVVMLITVMMVYCSWAVGVIVGCFTSYYHLDASVIKQLIYVTMFISYYGLLGSFLVLKIHHIGALIIPLGGYILTFLMTNPTTHYEEFSNYLVVLHMVFPDILIDISQDMVFLWGFFVILSLTIIILVVIYKRCKVTL